jgi:deazaflavin-dependent oxidoreductase (nitroreductase family)
MWRTIATLVVALVIVVVTIGVVFFFGMRTKSPFVQNTVRRFNRAFGNPHQMKTAGTPGAYASVIRHVGRKTGRSYETPMVAFATDDGFVIALPYGPGTDWVKNVLASGSATIVNEGDTWLIDQPELVPTAVAAPYLPVKEQRGLRRFAVDQCLRVRRAAPADGSERGEERHDQGEVVIPA